MRSLESKLQFGLALTLVVLMGLMWLIGSNNLRNMAESLVESRLEHDAEGLLAAMVVATGKQDVQLRWSNQVYMQPLSGHYYAIRFEDGHSVYSRSLWDQSLDIPKLDTGDSRRMMLSGPSSQPLLLLLNGYEKDGRKFTLGVAEDMTAAYKELDSFIGLFALLALSGLLVLLLVQSMVVRHSFKYLVKVREEIRQLEQGHVVKLSEDVPAEVLPLVQEFNHLLLLLSQRLERSRNGLGNLAHALKGPLNILTQYFDAHGNGIDIQQAIAQTQRIRMLMDRELKRARLAGRDRSSLRFDPVVEIPDLIEVLQQVHKDKHIFIGHSIAGSVKPFGDREDMLELFGNLLDNACKWAASKVSCSVTLGDDLLLVVEDDGSGLKDEDIYNLTQRGTRLDENVEGHGLGLAIVGDIVKLYDGDISFSRSDKLSGLCVRVRMPCVSV